jgi:hypothetical protein
MVISQYCTGTLIDCVAAGSGALLGSTGEAYVK